MEKLSFLFLNPINIMSISTALIPLILIHIIMFYEKMSKKKIIIGLIASFVIFPLCFYISYKNLYIVYYNKTNDWILFSFAFMGLFSINYITFLIIKYLNLLKENLTKSWKKRFWFSIILLIAMVYLSVPTFLMRFYLKSGNEKVYNYAIRLSVFPFQKEAVISYNKQNLIDVYLYSGENK